MANVKLTLLMEIGGNGTSDLYSSPPLVSEQKRGSVLFVFENDADRQISVKGEKLQYSDGDIVSGKITSISFQNADGDNYLTIDKVNVNVKALLPLGDDFGQSLYEFATRGNDTIRGSSDSDTLYGGAGRDKLIGGNGETDLLNGGRGNDLYIADFGSEYLMTGHGDGRDVVKHFDAFREGDEHSQDYIAASSDDYKIRRDGKDTIIDFGHGDMLVLEGIKT